MFCALTVGATRFQASLKPVYLHPLHMQRPSPIKLYALFAAGLVLLVLINVGTGSLAIPASDLFQALFSDQSSNHIILWQFRIPKAATCVLAGAALGASGLLMQTLFRNPLAGPDVLGLSSGASLLVALLLMSSAFRGGLLTSPWSVAAAASAGSAGVFLLVMTISRKIIDNTSLLIIGLMISAAVSSVVAVLQYISRADDLQAFMIWNLGSVGTTSWNEIAVMALALLAGLAIGLAHLKSINGLLLGDYYAQSLGINTQRTRFWVVAATSLMTGAVTAFCGPIAFVGLAVPHLVRLSVPSTNHGVLIPFVMMGGAILLLACDWAAQLPGSTQILPLNAITSFVGAPVVIWIIVRHKKLRM